MRVHTKQFSMLFITMLLMVALSSCKYLDDKGGRSMAEFQVTIENTGEVYPILKSGAFTTPLGASEPGPLMPGEAYEVEFTAPVGAHLSLATMFAQSNDWFFASDEDGIALYHENGDQVTGDVTAQIDLYDAGTEEDQEVGVGNNQAPRQSGPDTGPDDPNPNVRLVDDMYLPANEEMIRVTLTSTGTNGFRLRIENSSDANTLQTSEGSKPALLSPGTWLVHTAEQSGLLYTLGEPDYGDGLEAIAEDGAAGMLAEHLAAETGLTVPLSPGAYAAYSGQNPIFQSGEPAPDNGIEALAEDGAIDMLVTALEAEAAVSASGGFNQPVGASQPGPLLPGHQYQFTFEAEQGDRFTFATMYVQSNDLFYAPVEDGIRLFENGSPITGDITDQVRLWDAGTEANEEPGVGGNQPLRQSGPDTGPADDNSNVREVNDMYDYGEVTDHIRVTIQMVGN
ncbi:spondin domain-containing protein [Halalkalibaculum sp. DA3122]|uniref:spondin domain-containing protein n=1 Tax=Halalkalibaculum sp. DA3122 TaxID=3373607 RepID=UPI0037544DFA